MHLPPSEVCRFVVPWLQTRRAPVLKGAFSARCPPLVVEGPQSLLPRKPGQSSLAFQPGQASVFEETGREKEREREALHDDPSCLT